VQEELKDTPNSRKTQAYRASPPIGKREKRQAIPKGYQVKNTDGRKSPSRQNVDKGVTILCKGGQKNEDFLVEDRDPTEKFSRV
jgi:hypothetical protein